MTKITFATLAGMSIYSSILSLYQDFLGKERYLQVVSDHWVNSKYTIPLAIVCLIIWVTNYVSMEYAEHKNKK